MSVGLGRAGATEGDESGDIFLAFSTANANADEGNSAEPPFAAGNANVERMQSWKMDPLFTAVVQATEESVINAIIAAAKPSPAPTTGSSPHFGTINCNRFSESTDC